MQKRKVRFNQSHGAARVADSQVDRDFRVQIAAFFLTIRRSEYFVICSLRATGRSTKKLTNINSPG